MRRTLALLIGSISLVAMAQSHSPETARQRRSTNHAIAAERAARQAYDQVKIDQRVFENDVAVLRRLREADRALADSTQPVNALQTAYEAVDAAYRLGPESSVMSGVIRILRELDQARRSPAMSDFERLRSLLAEEALTPASRVVVRNSLRLEEETIAWLKVQEAIGAQLRLLSDVKHASLVAAQSER